jgi:hypothetical protein
VREAPAFHLAPEQAKSRAELDARAGLSGLGVLTYEALIGAGPFETRGASRSAPSAPTTSSWRT